MERRFDAGALAAAVGVATIGLLLLLDSSGAIRLRFAVLGPVVCATIGATLLAMGLTRRG